MRLITLHVDICHLAEYFFESSGVWQHLQPGDSYQIGAWWIGARGSHLGNESRKTRLHQDLWEHDMAGRVCTMKVGSFMWDSEVHEPSSKRVEVLKISSGWERKVNTLICCKGPIRWNHFGNQRKGQLKVIGPNGMEQGDSEADAGGVGGKGSATGSMKLSFTLTWKELNRWISFWKPWQARDHKEVYLRQGYLCWLQYQRHSNRAELRHLYFNAPF